LTGGNYFLEGSSSNSVCFYESLGPKIIPPRCFGSSRIGNWPGEYITSYEVIGQEAFYGTGFYNSDGEPIEIGSLISFNSDCEWKEVGIDAFYGSTIWDSLGTDEWGNILIKDWLLGYNGNGIVTIGEGIRGVQNKLFAYESSSNMTGEIPTLL
jgi:hypothetical protein